MSRLLNQFGRWLIAFVLALGGLAFRAGAEPARTTGSPRAIWVAARSYPGRPGHCLPEYRRRRALASRKQRAAPGRTWRRPPGCRPFGTTDRLRADRATEPLQDGGRRAELAEEGRRAVRGDCARPDPPAGRLPLWARGAPVAGRRRELAEPTGSILPGNGALWQRLLVRSDQSPLTDVLRRRWQLDAEHRRGQKLEPR